MSHKEQIAAIFETNPKEFLEWDANVLQYELNVRQWLELVERGEYEVLSHALQHNGEWLNVVRKVVAHGAVMHQDTFLINTIPHIRHDIEEMLSSAMGPFHTDFLDAIQTHFMNRNSQTKVSESLDEALKARAQQKLLQTAVQPHLTHTSTVRKL